MLKRVLPCLVLVCHGAGWAGSYEDCVLQGLRGVNSDRAAQLVHKACEAKRDEEVRAREARLSEEYGSELLQSELAALQVERVEVADPATLRVRVRNGFNQSVTYLRLAVALRTGGSCGTDFYLAYGLRLPPGRSADLALPIERAWQGTEYCVAPNYARVRVPETIDQLKSVSLSTIKPLPTDLFRGRSAWSPPPTPAPKAAPAASAPPDWLADFRADMERAAREAMEQAAPKAKGRAGSQFRP